MAQDRFYFWRGYWDALQRLPDIKQGEFVSAMCRYAFDGIEPTFEDGMLEFAWQLVKDQISTSVEIGRRQSERGKKSGESRRKKKKKEDANTVQNTDENGVQNGATNVMYCNVHSASRTSAGADALALDESEQWYVDNGLEVPFVPDESGGE